MEKKVYQTSDINLAATLLTLGFDVIGVNPTDPRRVYFILDDSSSNIEAVVQDFWADRIQASPKQLFNNRRDLLTRVREGGLQGVL